MKFVTKLMTHNNVHHTLLHYLGKLEVQIWPEQVKKWKFSEHKMSQIPYISLQDCRWDPDTKDLLN